MKKSVCILFLFLLLQKISIAQNPGFRDSVKHELSIAANDSVRVRLLLAISSDYRDAGSDSSMFYANKALVLARKINSPDLEIETRSTITLIQISLGNLSRALQVNLEAIRIAEKNSLIGQKPGLYDKTGTIYMSSGNFLKALNSFRKTIVIADSAHQDFFMVLGQIRMAETFLRMNQPDSALNYAHIADDSLQRLKINNPILSNYLNGILVPIFLKKGENEHAIKFIREHSGSNIRIFEDVLSSNYMAQAFHQLGISDSSIYYAKKALDLSLESKSYSLIIQNDILLSEIYEKRDPAKALQYSRAAIAYKDTVDKFSKNTTLDVLNDFDKQERQYEIEAATRTYQNKVRQYALLSGLFVLLLIAFILYRNNRQKRKANAVLGKALTDLKETQSQLIQSEKMASLGELTAGIAHEIQNPLNFVNNFSDVNNELLEELKEEVGKGNFDEVTTIANDVIANEEKINHHGKRADAIVKSMLEHSRTSTGIKEPTDINKLADEYLRLSYHGLKAKDKDFNAELKTDFDESIGKINIIPQDIGRVLLNLINNAFYAVNEKQKAEGESYKPEVTISTKKLDNSVRITVSDNGNGIPDAIKEKIFQPFFTTKPTGSGTGLGLSLSYDIVKANGGEIKVKTKDGMGSEFIIELPIT